MTTKWYGQNILKTTEPIPFRILTIWSAISWAICILFIEPFDFGLVLKHCYGRC